MKYILNRILFLYSFIFTPLFSTGAIGYRASATASCACGSGTTLTITKPTGVASGDLLIAQITMRLGAGYGSYTDMITPAGWTQLDMIVTPSAQIITFIYYKIAGGAEPASYGFTDNSVNLTDRVGAIVAYTGVDATSPFEAYVGQQTPSGSTHTTACALVTTTGSIIVTMHGMAAAAANTWTPPGGFTERYDATFTGGTTQSVCGTDNLTSPSVGSVGGYGAVGTSTGFGVACIFILRPSGIADTYGTFFVGRTTDFVLNPGPLVLRKPVKVIQNDFMIAHIVLRDLAGTVTPPAGWTLLRSLQNFAGQFASYICYLRAGAAEPATYSFAFTSGSQNDILGTIIAYRGITTTGTGIDVEAGQTTASSTSHSTPAITTTTNNDLLVALYSSSSTSAVNNWTPPALFTERYDVKSGQSTQKTLMVADQVLGTAGAVTAKTATAATSSLGAAEIIALKISGSPIADNGCAAFTVLPVELLYFHARCNDNTVSLTWSTATETNNDFFTIEKTTDGINYQTVAIVDGAGTSTQILSYSITDEEPLDKISYYRLKQTDFDENFSYSPIQAINCSSDSDCIDDIKITSDNNTLIINVSAMCSEMINLTIHNALGQLISIDKKNIEAGDNQLILNTDFANGLYILKISTENQTFQEKFVK
ncbi:MAG: T9SS type A sorting domain-containing protein [Bacteroidota bacterium]